MHRWSQELVHLDCIVEAQAKVGEMWDHATDLKRKKAKDLRERVILQEYSVQIGAVVKTFKKQAHKQIVVQARHHMHLV
jgi:hypothetical protein